jgi:hypothetical protein
MLRVRKIGICPNRPPSNVLSVRRTDFWERLDTVLGVTYARSWAHDTVLTELGLTVDQAFAAGCDTRDVWRAVCATIDIPDLLT